jgi:hypothetical protein
MARSALPYVCDHGPDDAHQRCGIAEEETDAGPWRLAGDAEEFTELPALRANSAAALTGDARGTRWLWHAEQRSAKRRR